MSFRKSSRIGAAAALLIAADVFAGGSRVIGIVQPSAPLRMAPAGVGIPGRYIVVFRDDRVSSARAVRAKIAVARGAAGTSVQQVYGSALFGYAAQLSDAALTQVRRDPDVAFVQQDQIVRANTTQSNPPWGLDRIDQRSLPRDFSYTYDVDGSGVHAYVIDTGIRATHVEFAGRVGAGYDVIDGGAPDDCHSHGTHVAGTIGGRTYGVAKNVTLHGVRVLDCQGSGTDSGVIAGIDWVTANHIKPAVANMSLGGGASPALDLALRNSVAAGVVHVVAAGNENTNACYGSPAREPLAITVGATGSTDQRASFSNYGSCLDLFAPGVSIPSSVSTSDTAVADYSGTSMASPHVAGAAALYLARFPSASPAEVAYAMTNEATTNVVGSPGSGSPNRLLYAALTSAPMTPTPGPSPTPLPTPPATSTPVRPANDDFNSPTTIASTPASIAADTTWASTAYDDPALCINGSRPGSSTVWHRYVAPADGTLALNSFGSSYDTVLAVFRGARGALTAIGCNDDVGSTFQSALTVPVTSGTTYWIEAADWNYFDSSSAMIMSKKGHGVGARFGGALVLNVAFQPSGSVNPTPTPTPTPTPASSPTSPPPPISHDDFDAARVMTALPYADQIWTLSATRADDDPPICTSYGYGSSSVWYRYVAPSAGRLVIDTFGSSYDTVLTVFTGARGSLTRRACNDDANASLQSTVAVTTEAGTTYWVMVADWLPWDLLNVVNGKGSIRTRVGGQLVLSAAFEAFATPTPTPSSTSTPTPTPTPTPIPTSTPTDTPTTSPTEVPTVVPSTTPPPSPTPTSTPTSTSTSTPTPTPTSMPIPSADQLEPAFGVNTRDQWVLLRGSNLDFVARVRLGNIELDEFFIVAPTTMSMYVKVPAGMPVAGYDLELCSAAGICSTLESAYRVIAAESDNWFIGADDVWTSPGVVRVGASVRLGVNVHREGGSAPAQAPVSFYVVNGAGRSLIGTVLTPPMDPGVDVIDSVDIAWDAPAASGPVTLVAVIDEAEEVEDSDRSDNVVTRTLFVQPTASDGVAPKIDSFTVADDAVETSQRALSLDLRASDDSAGGVARMYVVERRFLADANRWVAVQSSGWVPYATSSTFTLTTGSGFRILQVWVSDGAGNISTESARTSINYNAFPETVQQGEVVMYRYSAAAGLPIMVTLDSLSGDADLYVWDENGALIGASAEAAGATDKVGFAMPTTTTVQIEIHGYTDASYGMSVQYGASARTSARTASKELRTAPIIGPSNEPAATLDLPIPPTYVVYVPVLNR